MKSTFIVISFVLLIATAFSFKTLSTSGANPWTERQLISPAELAKTINDPAVSKPVIFSIGPSGTIKGAIDIGPTGEKANLNKLRTWLDKLPKDGNIVIYCGCCPFVHCPNIRPAFQLLNEMNFTNHKLLNLEHNLKADWIDNGYPMEK
jgi:thiosulfate/3-mercaptopyruvate sulfurtransferase